MKTNEISWLIKKFKIWRKNYFLVKLIKIQVLFQLLKIKLLWILNFRAYLCCFDIFCIVYWHFMLFFGPLHWQPPVAKGLFFLQEFQMMVIKGKFDHLQIIKIWLQFFEIWQCSNNQNFFYSQIVITFFLSLFPDNKSFSKFEFNWWKLFVSSI